MAKLVQEFGLEGGEERLGCRVVIRVRVTSASRRYCDAGPGRIEL